MKEGAKDDLCKPEKIKCMQIDTYFGNWLSGYKIHMGVVLQVHLARGLAL